MGSARARAISRQVQREKERIIDVFASQPICKQRAVARVAKSILLNAPYLINDKLWDVKAKSLGVGVYELRLVPCNAL